MKDRNKVGKDQQKISKYLQTKNAEYNGKSSKPSWMAEMRDSSHEHSQTDHIMEIEDHYNRKLCPQLVMIGPFDTIFAQKVKTQLKQLISHYDYSALQEFIFENNKRRMKISNLEGLDLTDPIFIYKTCPELLQKLSNQCGMITARVQMLHSYSNGTVQLLREQILLILFSMFLGIMPSQLSQSETSFGLLMALGDKETKQSQKYLTRLQKLKCIQHYFNCMVDNPKYLKEPVSFYRVYDNDLSYLKDIPDLPLTNVQFAEGKIENYYGKEIMVDFANERLGGGVLNNGAVQEEILFTIFPQCIVAKVLSEPLEDNEAMIISGARRFSNYKGYSHKFEFVSAYEGREDPDKSIIVAIDATNFKQKVNSKVQYKKKMVMREIHKAFVGFHGCRANDPLMRICTGRWGCGAFGADQILKFIIQWVAASIANREMLYITQPESIKNLRLLHKHLNRLSTKEILNVITEFDNFCRDYGEGQGRLLLYIKQYVI